MKNWKYIFTAALVAMVLASANVGLCDTTAAWTGPQQTGSLRYNGLILNNATITNSTVNSTNAMTGTSLTLSGDLAVNGDDITSDGDLTITPAGGDLIAAATIDATALTVDAGAGIDCKTAGTLDIGVATADAVDIGKTTEVITMKGPVNCDEAVTLDSTLAVSAAVTILDSVDTIAGSDMTVGSANATLLTLGASDITTAVAGALTILDAIDTAAGSDMTVGAANATKVEISKTGVETEIQGTLDVVEAAGFQSTVEILDSIDTAAGSDMTIGAVNATKVEISVTGVETEIQGTLDVVEAAGFQSSVEILDSIDTAAGSDMTVGSANATALALGAADITTSIAGAAEILNSLDTTAGTTMTVGPSAATRVEIADTTIVTDVEGPVILSEGQTVAYLSSTGGITLGTTHYVVSVTSAGGDATFTLPEASASLGTVYELVCDTAGNTGIILTDGTDSFDGTNTKITMNAVMDSVRLCATAADRWSVLAQSSLGFTTQ